MAECRVSKIRKLSDRSAISEIILYYYYFFKTNIQGELISEIGNEFQIFMTRFIEIWNHRSLLMFAYWIGEHQQESSFLRLVCLEVTNSHINGIPVRQQDFGSTKKLSYKLAALEVFLSNRNAFASVVASLKIYCTSRRVILRTSTTLPELNNV